MRRSFAVAIATLSLACAAPVLAQPAAPAALVAAQKEALAPLSIMDGVWRGKGWSLDPATRTRHDVNQTERVGPLLGGAVKLIEGRGYGADGSITFNAFAVVSYDPMKKTFTLSSWAMGRAGDFPLVPTAEGFIWTVPAGPTAVVRYTAVIKDGTWREIGEYVAEGQPPRQIFEMNLKRVGDSSWPEAGAVPME
ncbi:MAG: DUF1579 domain-containing protein [Caulobacter sp.]|nr:DUF1579 domain-containing protein [Caulobacter sp.]